MEGSPTKANVLERLKGCGVPVSAVVDVGVRECTGELIHAFRDKTHYLFEPVDLFFGAIERNYRSVSHELFPLALSDENTDQFLVTTSVKRDGVASHGSIRNQPEEVDGTRVIACRPISICRFDSLDVQPATDFLLKVDVDGQDLNVLRGFGDRLQQASVVLVEVTYVTLIPRLTFLAQSGFQFFDFVDLVYYGSGLYQFDAVFVRKDLVTATLRPAIANFDPALWRPL